jgi:hypothetical protein
MRRNKKDFLAAAGQLKNLFLKDGRCAHPTLRGRA